MPILELKMCLAIDYTRSEADVSSVPLMEHMATAFPDLLETPRLKLRAPERLDAEEMLLADLGDRQNAAKSGWSKAFFK